jgi:subtilisin-like proprotein convertase family protein
VQDINVQLDISHTYDSDLHVTLISPSGTRINLFTNVGPNGVNFHNTLLDDSALVPIDDPNAFAPYTGTFQPQEPLSFLNGESAFGKWQLEILDDSLGDTGALNSWSITVQLQGDPGTTEFLEPFQITDVDGNYTFDNLDPGLYNVREYLSPEQIGAGWQQTWSPPPVTVTSGADVQGVDFGNWIPTIERGSISGVKYYDANQNGVKDDQEAGLPGWIVYVDTNGNGVRDVAATPTVIPSTDIPKPILDLNTTTSQVTIGTLGTVTNVEVTLNITHSFVGDLTAYLRSPSGRIVELFTNVGSQYNNFANLTLTDTAARSISTLGFDDLPYTGAYQPEGQLADFAGEDAAGIWTLIVSDTTFADQGTLDSWSLSFTSSELFTTTDETGSYTFDNLLAGPYTVREENQPGWTAISPATVEIPAATWNNSQWNVVVAPSDDPNDPDGPTSKRLVQNVNFGNYGPAGGLQGQVYVDVDGDSSKDPGESGQPGWTVFIDSNGNGTLDLGAINQTISSGSASLINGSIVTTSKLWFGSFAKVTDIDVALDITHTYDADLTATLISPAGTRVKLFTGVGGSNDNFTGTAFDDAAATAIGAGTAPFSGSFKPLELLSAFNGQNANGFWTLEIVDASPADDGTLNSWSLTVKGDEISKVTDSSGNYSFTNLVPGAYTIAAVVQDGWTATQVPGTVIVGAAQTTPNVDFGFRITIALEGDYNRDGLVDNSDYIIWRRALGSTVPNFDGADGSGNGIVDQADFDVWRANFGRTLPPPPGSGSLVAQGSTTSATPEQANGATTEASMPATAVETNVVGVREVVSPVLAEVNAVASTSQTTSAGNAVSLVFAPAFGSVSIDHDAVVVEREAASASTSDLGLLAWLAASSSADGDDAAFDSLADHSGSADGDDSDSVESAFDEFEGCALLAATI